MKNKQINTYTSTTDLFGRARRVWSGDAHHSEKLLKLMERGRISLARKTNGGRVWFERSNPTTAESLALLVDSVGLDGTRNLIAAFLVRLSNAEPAAAALHVPKAAALAVLLGSFPTNETVPIK